MTAPAVQENPHRILAPESIPEQRPQPTGRGRPMELTRSKAQRLLDMLAAGNTYRASCAHAQIDYGSFRRWMIKGRKQRRGMFRDFFTAVNEAECQAELRAQLHWQTAIPTDWRAAQAWLKTRRARDWNVAEKVDGTLGGKPGAAPIPIAGEAIVRIVMPHNGRDPVRPEMRQALPPPESSS